MSDWTPGPWMVDRHETPKGDGVSLVRLAVIAGGHYIAWLSIHQEKGADARLIAAAPEMADIIESLAATDAHTNDCGVWAVPKRECDCWSASQEARALLARIRGDAEVTS